MTRDEILAMEAGRELDALVAERVMGWHQEYIISINNEETPIANTPEFMFPPDTHDFDDIERVPAYSTDIAAAWLVVEKMHSLYDASPNCEEGGTLLFAYNGGGSYAASFDGACDLVNEWWEVAVSVPYVAHACSAPLAICQAALLSEISDVG